MNQQETREAQGADEEQAYSISLWVLDDDGAFADTVPAWESEPCTKAVALPAYEAMNDAIARILCGWDDPYAVSLDALDDDRIGVCQQLRNL